MDSGGTSSEPLSPLSAVEEYVYVKIGDEGLVMDEVVLSLSPDPVSPPPAFKLSETKKNQELCHLWEDFDYCPPASSNCQANTCGSKSSSWSPSTGVAASRAASPAVPEQFSINSLLCAPPSSSFNDWAPLDDGIDKCQSLEQTDSYIDRVLYGRTRQEEIACV